MRSARLPPFALSVSVAAAACGGPSPPSGPSYHQTIAPLVAKNCLSCHRDGGIAPFSLETYADVRAKAGLIKTVTANRTMPPWGMDGSGACNDWVDALYLSDAEIASIGAWVDQGAIEGDPDHAPPASFKPEALSEISATADMGLEYTPSGMLTDDYRCFVLDPGLATDKYLTVFEVKPGDRRIVHHVILYSIDSSSDESRADRLDAEEPGPGYTCFGDSRLDGRFLAGWAPGRQITYYPPDTGIKLLAGHRLVMQVHYNTRNGLFPDRTKIDLVLRDTVKDEGLILPIGDYGLRLAPGKTYVEASHEISAFSRADVRAVFPHMHTLGRTLKVEMTRGTEQSCIVNVPRFDFQWQQLYVLEKPFRIEQDDKLKITCGYDTSSRADVVRWGEGTSDEMCLNFFYITSP
jgi:copper type II ascorbate-dependent monooxygenase-like protein